MYFQKTSHALAALLLDPTISLLLHDPLCQTNLSSPICNLSVSYIWGHGTSWSGREAAALGCSSEVWLQQSKGPWQRHIWNMDSLSLYERICATTFSCSAATWHGGSHAPEPWEVERSTKLLYSWEEYTSYINIMITGVGFIPMFPEGTKPDLK